LDKVLLIKAILSALNKYKEPFQAINTFSKQTTKPFFKNKTHLKSHNSINKTQDISQNIIKQKTNKQTALGMVAVIMEHQFIIKLQNVTSDLRMIVIN